MRAGQNEPKLSKFSKILRPFGEKSSRFEGKIGFRREKFQKLDVIWRQMSLFLKKWVLWVTAHNFVKRIRLWVIDYKNIWGLWLRTMVRMGVLIRITSGMGVPPRAKIHQNK